MRLARDPRARALLLVLVLLLSVGLAWHLVGPTMHEGMGALGLCLAVLALTLAFGPAPTTACAPRTSIVPMLPAAGPATHRPMPGGRHPPDLGDVLRR